MGKDKNPSEGKDTNQMENQEDQENIPVLPLDPKLWKSEKTLQKFCLNNGLDFETVKTLLRQVSPNVMRPDIKDKVFEEYFGNPEVYKRLIHELHPNSPDLADEVMLEEIKTNIFVDSFYNDLTLKVKDKVIILVEAQTKKYYGDIYRFLFYFVYRMYQEYQRVFDRNDEMDLAKFEEMDFEFWVIYTGKGTWTQKQDKKYYSLRATHKGNIPISDFKVPVLDVGSGFGLETTIGQYLHFCEIQNMAFEKYKNSAEAIDEIISICRKENIMPEIFENDNLDIRSYLLRFNEQLLNNINSEGLVFKEGVKVGKAEGNIEGEIRGTGKTLKILGFSKEEIKETLRKRKYSPELVESIVEEEYDKWNDEE